MVPGSSAVEQPAVNRLVDGSNPSRGATLREPAPVPASSKTASMALRSTVSRPYRLKVPLSSRRTQHMAHDNVRRLQDTFLEHLQRKRTPVKVFLSNGVKLRGIVAGFDAFCVLLDCDGHQQVVYKHAITTTSPAHAVDLQDKSGPVEHIPAAKRPLIVERRGRSRVAR